MNDSVVDLQQRRQEHQSAQSPGRRLREAREARKLSIENVARQLYLPDQTIRAIEEDDLTRLPHPTFVRGYLRNYARLVGLSEQDVRLDVPEAPTFPQQTVLEDETVMNRPGYRFASLAVLIPLILVGLLGWWIAGSDNAALKSPEPVAEIPESPLATLNEPALPPPTAATSPAEQVPPLPERMVNETPAPARPSQAAPAQAPSPQAAAEPTTPPETPPASAVPSPSPPSESFPLEETSLVFQFKGDSWTTVIDADGKKLLYGMGEKGSAKIVQGKPPFKVTIGRASNVLIKLNGKPFEHNFVDNGKPVRFMIAKDSGH